MLKLFLAAIAAALACTSFAPFATAAHKPRPARASACDHSFTGLASFYDRSSGLQTASGERFNDRAMTAAHRCLPFGTRLRIGYAGRSVVVRINDRGPFVAGRVLDLSQGAAERLGMTDAGVVRVTAEVIP